MGRWLPWAEIERRQRAADRAFVLKRAAGIFLLYGLVAFVWAIVILIAACGVSLALYGPEAVGEFFRQIADGYRDAGQ